MGLKIGVNVSRLPMCNAFSVREFSGSQPRVRYATLGSGCKMPSAFIGFPTANGTNDQTGNSSTQHEKIRTRQTATPFYSRSPGSLSAPWVQPQTHPHTRMTIAPKPQPGFYKRVRRNRYTPMNTEGSCFTAWPQRAFSLIRMRHSRFLIERQRERD